jgi:hypothetical protein
LVQTIHFVGRHIVINKSKDEFARNIRRNPKTARGSYYSSALYYSDGKNNNGDYQENMYEATQGIGRNKTKRPQYNQYNSD